MRFANFLPLALWAGLMFTIGCSGGETTSTPDESSGGETSSENAESGEAAAEPAVAEVKRVPTTSLPPTEGLSPMLDKGRLQVPLLPAWTIPPRKNEWLFRLQRDKRTAYPQILITVDDSFEPQEEKLNKSNVDAFVPIWQKQLEKTHNPKSFGENVSAVRIGKRYGVECLVHSKAGQLSLDQLLVSMIGAGRAYTFELRAQRGTLENYRMEFYAVVAGVKIEAPAAPTEGAEPMGETPAGEVPDETTPAEKAPVAAPAEAAKPAQP